MVSSYLNPVLLRVAPTTIVLGQGVNRSLSSDVDAHALLDACTKALQVKYIELAASHAPTKCLLPCTNCRLTTPNAVAVDIRVKVTS